MFGFKKGTRPQPCQKNMKILVSELKRAAVAKSSCSKASACARQAKPLRRSIASTVQWWLLQKRGIASGLPTLILDRAICYQHLYQFYENHRGFAVLYKKDAEAMLEIVEAEKLDELDQAYFINAKARVLFREYEGRWNFSRRRSNKCL